MYLKCWVEIAIIGPKRRDLAARMSLSLLKPSGVTKNPLKASENKEKIIEDLEGNIKAPKELSKRKACTFLQTVCQNMEGFTKHESKGANLVLTAQAIMGHPTNRELSQLISSNFGINDCPVNPIDVASTTVMYIPNSEELRTKNVRCKPARIH